MILTLNLLLYSVCWNFDILKYDYMMMQVLYISISF